MPLPGFLTVPDELLECALSVKTYFIDLGYNVKIEKSIPGFPYTPALFCNRAHTIIVVEVVDHIETKRLHRWAAFGKSNSKDFRVSFAIPAERLLAPEDERLFHELGLGCLAVQGAQVIERAPAKDLAINIALPKLTDYPKRVQQIMGLAYEQFGKGEWREGFESACQEFEAEARRYLKRNVKSGRITIQTKKGIQALSQRSIERLTMGGLAQKFGLIQSQNKTDAVILETLGAVNPDRVLVVHKKGQKRAESKLRENVGRNMWIILNALNEIAGSGF